MKRLIVLLMVVVLMLTFTVSAFAHPKGPDSMPEAAVKGLHNAHMRTMEVEGMAAHVVYGLLMRTGVESPH